MAAKKDIPGNARASHAQFERHVYDSGLGWLNCVRDFRRLYEDGVVITGIKIKGLWHGQDEYFMIIQAQTENECIVAFHSSTDEAGLWRGLSNRIRSGKLKWKVDEYGKRRDDESSDAG